MGLAWLRAGAQPVVTIEPSPPSCFGRDDGCWTLTLQQGVPPVTFTWVNLHTGAQGGDVLLQMGQPVRIEQLRAADYRFHFTDGHGVVHVVQASLTEPPPLEGHFFVFAPPEPCSYTGWVGFFQVKGGSPPYAYEWSNGHTSARLGSITSGLWRVLATDAKGCRVETDTLLQLPEPLQLSARVWGESCAGKGDGRLAVDSARGGIPPYVFALDNSALSPQTAWANLPPGLHVLRMEDAAGCSALVGAVVPSGLTFAFDAGPDTVLFQGDTLRRALRSSLPLQEISWQPAKGVLESGPAIAVLSPYFTTHYQLTALSTSGCLATTRLRVGVEPQRKVYAPNAFGPQAERPENRAFTLFGEVGVEQVVLLQVFDRQGQLLFENRNFPPNAPAFGWDGLWRGQMAPPGVYAWLAVVRYTNGKEVTLHGDVTLVR